MILLLAAALQAGDTFTLTVTVERMHCAECRRELEDAASKLSGFRSVKVDGAVATILLSEKAPVPAFGRLPKDLTLKSIAVSLRGTVVQAGEKITFVAKGSGSTLVLGGKVKALAEQLGGANRFRVAGTLEGRTLAVASFSKTDWK